MFTAAELRAELDDQALRLIDPEDPARLDFALFGLGIEAGELWLKG
jgi:hypothetical protein